MATYPRWTITVPPALADEITARAKGGRERSTTIARDLSRLYELYKLALREIPLTTGEACLICDVLNGTLMDVSSAAFLWAEVEDGIRLDGLGTKWNVDGAALVQRLKNLDRLTCLALVDAAERFWAGDLTEDARTAVQRYFYIRDEAGEESEVDS